MINVTRLFGYFLMYDLKLSSAIVNQNFKKRLIINVFNATENPVWSESPRRHFVSNVIKSNRCNLSHGKYLNVGTNLVTTLIIFNCSFS